MIVPRNRKVAFVNSCPIIPYPCVNGISILTNLDPDPLSAQKNRIAIRNYLYLICPISR